MLVVLDIPEHFLLHLEQGGTKESQFIQNPTYWSSATVVLLECSGLGTGSVMSTTQNLWPSGWVGLRLRSKGGVGGYVSRILVWSHTFYQDSSKAWGGLSRDPLTMSALVKVFPSLRCASSWSNTSTAQPVSKRVWDEQQSGVCHTTHVRVSFNHSALRASIIVFIRACRSHSVLRASIVVNIRACRSHSAFTQKLFPWFVEIL